MKIVMLVPPLHARVNEIVHGYMPPLGLLTIAGALCDAGHDLQLVDADAGHLSLNDVCMRLKQFSPHVVLVGHSGSIAANPVALEFIRSIKTSNPSIVTVYGGVYSSFTATELMDSTPEIDVIVQGEGEVTTYELITALSESAPLSGIPGLVWRDCTDKQPTVKDNGLRPPITNLDRYRVAWELVDWNLYKARMGHGRCAVVQFSRGCPNRCTFCGQWRFWRSWRHRSIDGFINELNILRKQHNVKSVWIADENWGADAQLLHELLQAIASADLDLDIYCAMCARDVVRDAHQLELFKRAGVAVLMMGIESLDDAVLNKVGKDNPIAITRQAIQLLRDHGILSIVNVIHGLQDETLSSIFQSALRLRKIGPDFYNALYFTPLPWTAEGQAVAPSDVFELDQRRWDFRKPVIRPKLMTIASLVTAVKISELLVHFRLLWFLRTCYSPDAQQRRLFRHSILRLITVFLQESLSLLRPHGGKTISRPEKEKNTNKQEQPDVCW